MKLLGAHFVYIKTATCNFFPVCMETAELNICFSVTPLYHTLFVLFQAENDLNELRALMHSPNAIVVSFPHSTQTGLHVCLSFFLGTAGASRMAPVVKLTKMSSVASQTHNMWFL